MLSAVAREPAALPDRSDFPDSSLSSVASEWSGFDVDLDLDFDRPMVVFPDFLLVLAVGSANSVVIRHPPWWLVFGSC
jgi:hypothetical protein